MKYLNAVFAWIWGAFCLWLYFNRETNRFARAIWDQGARYRLRFIGPWWLLLVAAFCFIGGALYVYALATQ